MNNDAIRALLIEDNAGDARLVREALSHADGIELEWLDRLSAGLARLRQPGIDVVLLDLTLPDAAGFGTIEHLNRSAPHTPIVALSGLGDNAQVQDAIKYGAEDYLVKGSFSPDLLARSLRYAIDRRRARQELAQARDSALESARLRSEFLANMSHEIRTPLNGIVGVTRLLMDTRLGNDQREMLEIARHSADSLLAIVNDILDFSKISAGKVALEETDFDLGNAIESVVAVFAEQAQSKGLELASYVETDVPVMLRGDPARLCQILTNLVGNAVKFTPQGSVTVRVALTREGEDELTLRFTVKDSGIGIPLEGQRYLFQAFAQADGSTTRKFGGTGLGLAISAQLVELMGGNIGVQSEPGGGSTFWFTAALRKQPSSGVDPAIAGRLAGVRMLVVDHNASAAETIRRHAEAWRMHCEVVSAPAEALVRLKSAASAGQPFDIVIIEVQQGKTDGLRLGRAISDDNAFAHTRLLGSYPLGARPDENQMRAAGMRSLLVKPIRQSQLFNTLNIMMASIEETDAVREGAAQASRRVRDLRSKLPEEMRKRTRILMVEDNIVNQQVQVRMLERIGLRVDSVSNGREAVEALEREDYAIVLMDCQMPEVDGYTATREIRHRERSGHHRRIIIGVTAHALAGDREECLAAGMDDYISKPVVPEVLGATLDKWILHLHEKPATTRLEARESEEPILDPAVLAALRECQRPGEPDFVRKIITAFLDDYAVRHEVLCSALLRNDLKSTRDTAHSLKGAAAEIGASRVGAACALMEAAAAAGDRIDLDMILRRIEVEVDRVRHTVAAEVASAAASERERL